MKLSTLHKASPRDLHEGWMSEIGHLGLDLAGFIPGLGEAADLTNALWYIKEEQWISAALSFLSMVPELGDVVGKGIKYLGRGSATFARFMAKYGDDIAKHWDKVVKVIQKIGKIREQVGEENIQKMDQAFNKMLRDWKSGNQDQERENSRRERTRQSMGRRDRQLALN